MDRNLDYNQYDMNMENDMFKDPMFSPAAQYEQAYMYYKYLTQQMDYKIKCREYDKMCKSDAKRE